MGFYSKPAPKVGDVLITNTSENPANKYRGNWELLKKKLKVAYLKGSDTLDIFTPTTDNMIVESATAQVIGELAIITVNFTLTKERTDGNVTIGYINYENIGFTKLTQTAYTVACSDDGNALLWCGLHYDTGKLYIYDVFSKEGNSIMPANNPVQLQFIVKPSSNTLIDSFCDEFIWKRTA